MLFLIALTKKQFHLTVGFVHNFTESDEARFKSLFGQKVDLLFGKYRIDL